MGELVGILFRLRSSAARSSVPVPAGFSDTCGAASRAAIWPLCAARPEPHHDRARLVEVETAPKAMKRANKLIESGSTKHDQLEHEIDEPRKDASRWSRCSSQPRRTGTGPDPRLSVTRSQGPAMVAASPWYAIGTLGSGASRTRPSSRPCTVVRHLHNGRLRDLARPRRHPDLHHHHPAPGRRAGRPVDLVARYMAEGPGRRRAGTLEAAFEAAEHAEGTGRVEAWRVIVERVPSARTRGVDPRGRVGTAEEAEQARSYLSHPRRRTAVVSSKITVEAFVSARST